MDKLKEIQDGLGSLITDTVMTNQEGYKRQITTEDLNDFTKWMDIIDDVRKDNQDDLKNAALSIFDVRASALIKSFAKWNDKYPKGRIYSINSKDGMEMIMELDELAEQAKELSQHLP